MKAHTSYYQIGKPNGEIVFACESMNLMECFIMCKQRGFVWGIDVFRKELINWDTYSRLPM